MKMIESPCQTLQRLNNLFQYLEYNTYQCQYISLNKLSFQKFKKFPIPQPFIDRESEYLLTVKQLPKISQQNKPDLKLPETPKNLESLKEFTSYVQNIKQQRKLRKQGQQGQHNMSAINFKPKKEIQQFNTKLVRQNSTHQGQIGKKRNVRAESQSPRQQPKNSNWAKELFQKLDNDSFRTVMAKQNKNEQQSWNIYHKKSYERKIYDLELRPQTQQAIKQFQKSLLDKIQ